MFFEFHDGERSRVAPFEVREPGTGGRPIRVVCAGCDELITLPLGTRLADVCDRLEAREAYYHDDACRARDVPVPAEVFTVRGRYRRRLARRADPARANVRAVVAALRAMYGWDSTVPGHGTTFRTGYHSRA